MRRYKRLLGNAVMVYITAVIFSSCASTKNIPYFRDVSDSTKLQSITDSQYQDPLIIPDDILSITIVTIDPQTAAPVNQAVNAPVASSSLASLAAPQPVQGLLVDKDGYISLPIIGQVKVAGLTTFQAKALLKKKAEQYFKDPDVQLRFANFKITVIGEVSHPSTFAVPNEKVSILDALGMAGDLTIYGRRDNVLLIRENNGKKELSRLNLNSSDLFKSPYFYLKQNDVVYVEPSKSRMVQADATQTRVVTVAASILAALLIVLIRVVH